MGLCKSRYASPCFESGRPSSSTWSRACTNVFSCPRSPLTVTRPALISSSAPRRDATPARASHAFRRMSAFSPWRQLARELELGLAPVTARFGGGAREDPEADALRVDVE